MHGTKDHLWHKLIFIACFTFHHTLSQNHCTETDTFVKISGYSPSRDDLLPLFSSPGHAVTRECYQRCKSSSDCAGFLVDYSSSTCYRVSSYGGASTTPRIDYGYHYSNLTNINYFQRICINSALIQMHNCSSKGWIFERVQGFELIGFDTAVYIVDTTEQCMQLCLQEKRFICRSAEYIYAQRRCVLSHQNRRSQTDAYRASSFPMEYLENQCVDPVPTGQTCSFEEHQNRTLASRDLEFPNLSQNECHDKCVKENNFICRAATFVPSTYSSTGISECWLHSDDTISLGPQALQVVKGAIFMERAPCLDLMVICSEESINITLHTVEPFKGRMYVSGFSNACDVEGFGGYLTTLSIPMTGTGSSNKCGITIIKSVSDTNRTLLSTVIVIQRNPIVLRRGDRAVKVGCLLDASFKPNSTVNASLTVTGPDNISTGGTTVLNNSSVPPTVRIRIIDYSTGNPDAKEAELGQELEFRIDVEPDNGPFDIMAGHLVATSADGSESILLLNEKGCPPDPTTFPAFRKVSPNSKSLVANFRAFKFYRSPVVRFNVMVQFCPGRCARTDCGNGIVAYGRRKREFETNATLYQEMPLETAIIVRSPQLLPSSLLSAGDANGKIVVGLEDAPGSICVYYGAIIGLVIAWLLLQFLILIGCYIVVRERYKRRRDGDDNSMEHKLEDDFNGYDNNRHVHWADEGSRTW
ncbi:hypothetical protein C0J52_13172 [Blattella germanica]|nr:hypothetical protein C0J52_13172 [Blattella germanica]